MLDLGAAVGLALAVTISPPRRDPAGVADLEALVARTWSRRQPTAVGPWLLRVSGGFTLKANAVAVLGPVPPAELGSMIEKVEAFYTSHGLPTCFEITDRVSDSALAPALLERGYVAARGEVEVTLLSPLRTLRSIAPAVRDGRVVISDTPISGWLDRWWSTLEGCDESQRDLAAELVWDLRGRCGFASHLVDGEVVATGLGLIEGPWLGMYCLGVGADRRRRGSARRILGALATWGTANAALQGYVCVRDDGSAARSLFEGLGFSRCYRSEFLRRTS